MVIFENKCHVKVKKILFSCYSKTIQKNQIQFWKWPYYHFKMLPSNKYLRFRLWALIDFDSKLYFLMTDIDIDCILFCLVWSGSKWRLRRQVWRNHRQQEVRGKASPRKTPNGQRGSGEIKPLIKTLISTFHAAFLSSKGSWIQY